MGKNKLIAGVVVGLVLVVAAVWIARRRGEGPPILAVLDQFEAVEKRPSADVFAVAEVTLGNETRRVITTRPASRLTWTITLPNDAWLRTAVAVDPSAWTVEGDGILCRIGVSDGRSYDALFTQHVNPYASASDRRWILVAIDLSAYGGRRVDIIFNTNSSLPGQGDDTRGDLAIWGAPAVYLR